MIPTFMVLACSGARAVYGSEISHIFREIPADCSTRLWTQEHPES